MKQSPFQSLERYPIPRGEPRLLEACMIRFSEARQVFSSIRMQYESDRIAWKFAPGTFVRAVTPDFRGMGV